ncbi:hypothetical protein J6590_029543 [Homalodisca vitripennis]|nr:hypothetical protein J6590_029543 [Homalodisca vitripennis]
MPNSVRTFGFAENLAVAAEDKQLEEGKLQIPSITLTVGDASVKSAPALQKWEHGSMQDHASNNTFKKLGKSGSSSLSFNWANAEYRSHKITTMQTIDCSFEVCSVIVSSAINKKSYSRLVGSVHRRALLRVVWEASLELLANETARIYRCNKEQDENHETLLREVRDHTTNTWQQRTKMLRVNELLELNRSHGVSEPTSIVGESRTLVLLTMVRSSKKGERRINDMSSDTNWKAMLKRLRE